MTAAITRSEPYWILWDELDSLVPQSSRTPLLRFRKALFQAWLKIGQSLCTKLVDSMPNKLKCVIHGKGGPARYQFLQNYGLTTELMSCQNTFELNKYNI